MADRFDLVVLGAGSAGYACALRAAHLGLTVGLVEKDKVGGTCLHRGCIPTKAILHAAEVADAAREGAQFGIHATIDKIDLAGVRGYADGVVGRLYKGLSGLIAGRDITVVPGAGRLRLVDGSPAVQVGDRVLQAAHLVLASGSYARSLPGLEIDGAHILTSDHAVRLDSCRARPSCSAAGSSACEFASAWRSFGVEVTVVEALPRLLPAEEPAISAALERAFRKRKITVFTGTPLRPATATAGGVRVVLRRGPHVEADLLLVAVGRGPQTDGLGYPEAGIVLEDGFVTVERAAADHLSGVYAVGDLVAGLQLAHRGFAHGIFVAEEIAYRLGRHPVRPVPVPDDEIPRVTYCDPEVASVGLTEESASARFGVGRDADLRPRRQRQVADPADPGFRQAGAQTRGSGRRRAHDRRPGRRADR